MASEQQTVEQVYFFRKSKRKSKGLNVADSWVLNIGMSLGLVLFIAAIKLCRICGLSVSISFVAIILPIGVLVVRLWRYSRQLRDLPSRPPDEDVRLAIVGPPQVLEQLGGLADLLFEPVFFSAAFVLHFSRVMTSVAVVLSIPTVLAVHCLVQHLEGRPLFEWPHSPILETWTGSGIAVCIVGWFCPAYFRLVPGRLDVLRFNNLLNRPVSVEHYNLRTAKLLIDLRRSVIFIDDADGRTGEFPIVWMRRSTRERLAYHLLLAALSSYQAPDLPDDRLLG